ncbi:MAG: NADH-quinone oxidoreductase subunit NuoG [Thermodesulfobacteriota bacterium]
MANITIDGNNLTVEDGIFIVEAARSIGIEIPTFCYYAKLSRLASCRLCLVEIEGQRKMQPACATPVADGMVINTNTPNVIASRRAMLEFLLANHPLDCPICDQAGECELQDKVFAYGPREGRFAEDKRSFHTRDYTLSPVIIKNSNRCVQCQRCVRVCKEIVGAGVLGAIGRGAATEDTSFMREPLECDQCGNCIEICPVGSLMSLPYRYKARPWDLVEVDTICPYCSTGCHLTIGLRDGKFLRVRSKKEKGINEETLCVRGRFGLDFISSEKRLKRPLLRKYGVLVPVSWEEALSYIKTTIGDILAADGGEKIGGVASARLTNEELYLFQKMMRTVFKTNHIDSTSRLGGGGFYDTLKNLIPGKSLASPLPRALDADTIFVLGSKVDDENPVTDYALRRILSTKPVTLISATPRDLRLDTQANVTLRYRPGQERSLLSAILKGIIDKVGDKEKRLKKEISNFMDFKKSFAISSQNGAGISEKGLVGNAIKGLLESKKLSIFIGMDVLRYPRAGETLHGIFNLISILELLGKETVNLHPLMDRCNQRGAWDMGVTPSLLPGYIKIDDGEGRTSFEEQCKNEIPSKKGLDVHNMLQGALKRNLRALYIAGNDIMIMYPDGGFVKEALSKLELVIVQDAFHTETAKHAHVVLPGATFAEKEGTITNSEGRVQRIRRVFNSSFEAKNDIEIFREVAETVGGELTPVTPQEAFSEIQQVVPAYKDIEWDNGGFLPLSSNGAGREKELYIPKQSEHKEEKRKGFYYLHTGNPLFHSGVLSQETKLLNEFLPASFIGMSKKDADALGLEKDTSVRVIAENGNELVLKVKITKDVPQGVVFIPENFRESRVNQLLKRDKPSLVKVLKVTENVS